jgi:hypothetical protein
MSRIKSAAQIAGVILTGVMLSIDVINLIQNRKPGMPHVEPEIK